MRLRGRFVPDESLLSQELRRKLWEGMIALKIDLAIDDHFSMEKPRSLYVSHQIPSPCQRDHHLINPRLTDR